MDFALFDKIKIFFDVWLQIINHVHKVELELSHLLTLLKYWGNVPCAVRRLSPSNASQDRSHSCSRWHSLSCLWSKWVDHHWSQPYLMWKIYNDVMVSSFNAPNGWICHCLMCQLQDGLCCMKILPRCNGVGLNHLPLLILPWGGEMKWKKKKAPSSQWWLGYMTHPIYSIIMHGRFKSPQDSSHKATWFYLCYGTPAWCLYFEDSNVFFFCCS